MMIMKLMKCKNLIHYLSFPLVVRLIFCCVFKALNFVTIQFKDIGLLQNNLNVKLVFLGAPSVVHDTLN